MAKNAKNAAGAEDGLKQRIAQLKKDCDAAQQQGDHETAKALLAQIAELEAQDDKKYPEKIRLTHPHSFYDEDGNHRQWPAGFIATDPVEVKLFIDRGALLEVVEA